MTTTIIIKLKKGEGLGLGQQWGDEGRNISRGGGEVQWWQCNCASFISATTTAIPAAAAASAVTVSVSAIAVTAVSTAATAVIDAVVPPLSSLLLLFLPLPPSFALFEWAHLIIILQPLRFLNHVMERRRCCARAVRIIWGMVNSLICLPLRP